MKKKRLLSLILVSSMLAGLCNLHSLAAENSQTSAIALTENFDSYETGDLSDVLETDIGYGASWSILDSNTGDSVTVASDPVTGSKALRVSQAKQTPAKTGNPETGLVLDFDPGNSGIINIRFKVRQEVNSSNLSLRLFGNSTYGRAFGYYHIINTLYTTGWKNISKLMSNGYSEFDIEYNVSAGSVVINTTSDSNRSVTLSGISHELNQLRFAIAANYSNEGSTDWVGADESDPVYWFDDISVYKKGVEVEGFSPSNGSTVNEGINTVSVDFNTTIDLTTASYISVSEDGVNIDGLEYDADENDPTVINITLPENTKSGSKYKIVVAPGVVSTDSAFEPLGKRYEAIFKHISQNVIASENFDDYDEHTKVSDVLGGNWTIADSKPGDSVTVETDPITGSKALRVSQTKQTPAKKGNPETGLILDFEPGSKGIIDIHFKVRQEVNSSNLSLGLFGNSTYGRALSYYHIVNTLYTTGWKNISKLINGFYSEFDILYNVASGTVEINTSSDSNRTVSATLNHELDQLRFAIAANYSNDGADGWIGTDNADPVYWFDDISVTRKGVEVESFTPSNGSVVQQEINKLSVDFNTEINIMTASNISVYEDGILIDGTQFEKDENDLTVVNITLPRKTKVGSKYKIVVNRGITSSDETFQPLEKNFASTFKCMAENIIVSEDFEDYEDNSRMSDIFSGNWTVIDNKPGDSVTIETDPATGSKAVRISQAKQTPSQRSNPETGFWLDFIPAGNGITDISFKIRREVSGSNLSDSFFNDTANGKVIGIYHIAHAVYNNSWKEIFKFIDSGYTTVNIAYNSINGTYTITSSTSPEREVSSARTLNQIRFAFAANWWDGASEWIETDEEDPVYWIDDIKIEKRVLKAQSIEHSGNSLIATFNSEVDDSYITKDYFEIYKDGVKINNYTIAKSSENSNEVVLMFDEKPEYNVTYTVNIPKGIASADQTLGATASAFTKDFVFENAISDISITNTNGADVEDLSEYKGQTINVSAKVKEDLDNYIIYAAIKDENGRLKTLNLIYSTDVINNNALVSLIVPYDATDEYTTEIFIFDSATQAPLAEKITVKKKQI